SHVLPWFSQLLSHHPRVCQASPVVEILSAALADQEAPLRRQMALTFILSGEAYLLAYPKIRTAWAKLMAEKLKEHETLGHLALEIVEVAGETALTYPECRKVLAQALRRPELRASALLAVGALGASSVEEPGVREGLLHCVEHSSGIEQV